MYVTFLFGGGGGGANLLAEVGNMAALQPFTLGGGGGGQEVSGVLSTFWYTLRHAEKHIQLWKRLIIIIIACLPLKLETISVSSVSCMS